MEYTLGNFRQLLDHFSGIKPAHVLIFAYDSGGCSCAQCRPWVTNGYPKAAARVARLVKEKHPGAEVALVTWAFTPDEWADLNKAVAARPADWEWADSVLATLVVGTGGASPRFFLFDAPKKAGDAATARLTCGDRPLLAFARMGAHDMYPWGAFGANPTPEGCQAAWNLVKHQSHGGWPYSEGIFDDINKAIFTQFGWSPDRPASEIVREYVAFEYSPDVVEDVCRAIKTLECNHRVLRWVDGMLIDRVERNPDKPEPAPPDPATDAAYKTLQRMETKLTAYARNSWRWRILYLRALLDSELRRNGGRPTKQCEEAFRELTEIYHAQKAGAPIKPPGP
jgi:hypothetical protein